ncbi:hypothetical protein NBO_420g0001 [Nosema bombycis CQ1]|uniref:Uncharacterized protein n=1 Tax=Nosema bombycis (strain CQ1 / CVCC 102059) TaxID=578461 RepID=R0MEH6_NOSB1|nr:hypothetical protein NBO_420g0001 [Nosema bombycis CQ1]|eukprot:EOB12510.1 hypothetical protein NBO_420g0001 [Nosema bombycis CQ1]
MEKQEKKKENEMRKIKVGKRREKKEMNKLLTKKDVMDEAFRRIREMEKYREKSNVVDLSKVNDKAKDKAKDEKKVTKDSKVDKKVKENAKDSKSTKNIITKDSKPTKPTTTNPTQPTKRKSSGYIWVKKRNPTKESQTLKIYTNPLDRTRAALLDKLERKLNDYFSVVPEDLKKVNVFTFYSLLKGIRLLLFLLENVLIFLKEKKWRVMKNLKIQN